MIIVIRIDLSGVLFKIFFFLVIYKCTGMYNGCFIIKESLGKVLLFKLMHLEGSGLFSHGFVDGERIYREDEAYLKLLIKEEEGEGRFT